MSVDLNKVVAVVGLGYVGLPLAIEFGKKYRTIGYDVSEAKIDSYRQGRDPNGEVDEDNFRQSVGLEFSNEASSLKEADIVIVAVPTPVDAARIPDFSPLVGASTTVAKNMKRGAIVVYESTVYPGATEEVCIPLLEKFSGMRWMDDFHVGYSPERVNPGDKERTITKIIKIVSGDDQTTLELLADLYGSIITAGVHKAQSIKVAEAAKVIENTQRDLNIALMNELSIIFGKLNIDTAEVLQAAGTKWNFLPFRPGLVGGHCIGVDPYYLTHKAEMLGYHPEVILAGRRINDGMAAYAARQIVKQLIHAGSPIKGAKITVLGLTFKENCSDLRNSKVADLINELVEYGCDVTIHDPLASHSEAMHEYGLKLTDWKSLPKADAEAVVVAVAHREYLDLPIAELLSKLQPGGIFVDIKSAFPVEDIVQVGARVWRL